MIEESQDIRTYAQQTLADIRQLLDEALMMEEAAWSKGYVGCEDENSDSHLLRLGWWKRIDKIVANLNHMYDAEIPIEIYRMSLTAELSKEKMSSKPNGSRIVVYQYLVDAMEIVPRRTL